MQIFAHLLVHPIYRRHGLRNFAIFEIIMHTLCEHDLQLLLKRVLTTGQVFCPMVHVFTTFTGLTSEVAKSYSVNLKILINRV